MSGMGAEPTKLTAALGLTLLLATPQPPEDHCVFAVRSCSSLSCDNDDDECETSTECQTPMAEAQKETLHRVVIAVVLRTRLLNVRGVLSSGIGVDGHRHLILRDGDDGPSGSDNDHDMASSSSVMVSNEWKLTVQMSPLAHAGQQ